MVRRAVKPVEIPKSIRPGERITTSALAATGAMRFDRISTGSQADPDVVTAAAPMATKISALSNCVS